MDQTDDNEPNPWQRLESRVVYDNAWIRVREDRVLRPTGGEGVYGVVESKTFPVFVVAITDRQEILFVRLFRYPQSAWSWEIPSGGSEGQPLLDAARRELREETGYEAERVRQIGKFYSLNGVADELGIVVLAEGLKPGSPHEREEEGISRVEAIPLETVYQMIYDGTINDGQTLAALLQAQLWFRFHSSESEP